MEPRNNPKGSFHTVAQVRVFTQYTKPDEKGLIYAYDVNGVFPDVTKIAFPSNAIISNHEEDLGPFIQVSGFERSRSLNDWGIGADYNDNRLFLKIEDAEAYVQHLLTDPDLISNREAHLARCREMDRHEYFYDYED